ncbi:MAG: hypothetical protein HONBIEJF_02276 [Fimbriimonadaceae bacterium]|nr:hypothetical protein [Fimbriimonadaceae bacterium]
MIAVSDESLRHAKLAGLAYFGLLGLAALIYLIEDANSSATIARKNAIAAVESFLNDNPQEAFQWCDPAVAAASGIDERRFAEAWRRLISPRLKNWTQDGGIDSWSGEPNTATAEVWMRHPSGIRIQVALGPVASKSGMSLNPMSFLYHAWTLDAAVRRGGPIETQSSLIASWLNGLRRDRPTLEALGVNQRVRGNNPLHVQTWAETDSRFAMLKISVDN